MSKSIVRWNSNAFATMDKLILDALERNVETITKPLAKDLCPVDLGPLRDSAETERIDRTIWLSFGKGPSKDYAVYQHERTDLYHDDGECLYLKKAFDRTAKKVIDESLKEAKVLFNG